MAGNAARVAVECCWSQLSDKFNRGCIRRFTQICFLSSRFPDSFRTCHSLLITGRIVS
jgi:hypothetical protein